MSELFTVVLSEDEKPLYISSLNKMGYDPDIYRDKRRITAPPEHYGEIVDSLTAMTFLDSIQNNDEILDQMAETFELPDFHRIAVDLIQKCAREVNEIGKADRAEQAMLELGPYPTLFEFRLMIREASQMSHFNIVINRTLARVELDSNPDTMDEFYEILVEEMQRKGEMDREHVEMILSG